MNAVGIDVSNGKSMVAVQRPFDEVVKPPFEVRHNAEALMAFFISWQLRRHRW